MASSSSVNPGWDESMPAWNLTTECVEWSKDYHPCSFPYTGLSSYSPSSTHCNILFSESFPDAFEGIQAFFLVSNSLIFLLLLHRFALTLVDVGYISSTSYIGQKLSDLKFKRAPRPNRYKPGTSSVSMNVYDYCNCCMLAASFLQVIVSCDIEGWSDRIPYKVHVTLGVIAQNMAIMTGIPITVNWMNLIHVWSNPIKNHDTVPKLGIKMRNTALATIWFISFPITFSALFVTDSCDNGCENGNLTCAGKTVFSFVLFTIVLFAAYYCYQMHLVLKSNDEFNWKEFFAPRWHSVSVEDDERKIVANRSGFIVSKRSGSILGKRSVSSESMGTEDSQKIIWEQIRKIWKIVFVSVCLSISIIADNFSYCTGHFNEIKYESPPCSVQQTIFDLPMMWTMFGGSVLFLMLVPYRQQKQSAAAKKVLVERINSNIEVTRTSKEIEKNGATDTDNAAV